MLAADPPRTLPAGLSRALGRLRRVLNRQVRASAGISALSESQLELLRLVARRPGLRVQDAAQELMLAPNTVSTLVQRLAAAHLLEREADARDGRVARLHLAPPGAEELHLRRDRRHEILAGELARLDPDELRAVAAAVPVLERIAATLEVDDAAGRR